MLYFLNNLESFFGPFRLFEYVTFRAGGAFATAFLLVMFAVPPLLPFFRKHCVQKSARTDDAPVSKARPPLAGGIIIVGAVVIASVLWGRITERMLIVFILATLAFALLGLVDDCIKVRYLRQERDGVKERTKLIVQFLVAVVAVYALYKTRGTVTMKVFCPFSKMPFQFLPNAETISLQLPYMSHPIGSFSAGWMIVCLTAMLGFNALVIAGTSNGVNLTDGKDGLSSGCMIFASLVFAAISYLCGHRIFAEYLGLPYVANAGEVGIYACAIAGGCVGFLWHNCAPASIIMGDTGSLALGGALALIAVMLGQQLLLPVIGFVFMAETLSVWIQRKSFRWRHGKRVFLMTPIHHHFEKLGVLDHKLTVRFWIVAGLSALLGLMLLKLR